MAYRKEDEDVALTEAEFKKIRAIVAEEANKAVARHVGDVVTVPKDDPAYDPKNETVRVSTALTWVLARTGKAQGQ